MAEGKNHRSSSGIGRTQFSLAGPKRFITLFEILKIALFYTDDGLWLSLVERLVRDQEAVGSNPTSPIDLLINTLR